MPSPSLQTASTYSITSCARRSEGIRCLTLSSESAGPMVSRPVPRRTGLTASENLERIANTILTFHARAQSPEGRFCLDCNNRIM